MTDLRGQGVRVLLIGTAEYSGPSLPSLPSVGRSVAALSAALRERCGVGGEQLRVVLNPQDARTMAEAVAEEAHTAESVLVIYYLGHGLLGPGDELYLSASGTGELVPGLAAHQALPFSAITEALAACRASSVLVVLDCCFPAAPPSACGRPDRSSPCPPRTAYTFSPPRNDWRWLRRIRSSPCSAGRSSACWRMATAEVRA